MGGQRNVTRGKAIMARERQGDVSNFHFLDNLSWAIQYCGQCLVDIIPSVYSTRQTIRILGEDMTEKVINLTQEAGGTPGENKLYNLSVGKYDVTVKTGPSFTTQREETRETLIELMRAVPAAAPVVGDALLEHMDFQGADKIAKRLKAMLPPNIQALEDEKISQSDNPEAAALQAQLEQGKQQMQQMQQQGQSLMQEMDALKKDKSADVQVKMADLEVKKLELGVKQAEAQNKMMELQQGDMSQEEKQAQWDYDMQVLNDKQQHEAIQKDADRQMQQEAADNDMRAQDDKQQHEAIQKLPLIQI